MLVRSTPAAGDRVAAAPQSFDFWFSEPLEAGFSRFELYDARAERLPVEG